ncbi:RNA-binding motif protein, X-linked [Paramyrothecium foliicola]|nr:RNA-binding motif protein, X-linked [Paramyrothecium foliicola]
MNKIRAIQDLNKKEIEHGITPNASWHVDYRDTAYIYFGGLPYELSEGDVITIFSQFGEPTFLKLARDKESGKSKGFGWLKYEDQRSTDLAVDNLGGAQIGGRLISVDHARYKARDDEDLDQFKVGWEDIMRKQGQALSEEESSDEEVERRPMLPEEIELAKLMRDHDDDDPMKGFLIEEKKREVEDAKREAERRAKKKHRHSHHRSHRSTAGDGKTTNIGVAGGIENATALKIADERGKDKTTTSSETIVGRGKMVTDGTKAKKQRSVGVREKGTRKRKADTQEGEAAADHPGVEMTRIEMRLINILQYPKTFACPGSPAP